MIYFLALSSVACGEIGVGVSVCEQRNKESLKHF